MTTFFTLLTIITLYRILIALAQDDKKTVKHIKRTNGEFARKIKVTRFGEVEEYIYL